jgi:hypothetical protein
MPRLVSLPKRFAELIPELAKFGVVGLVGSIVDLGGAAYLHGAVGIGPMVSKGLSIIAATALTYLGSRFWTFRHRVNQALLREGIARLLEEPNEGRDADENRLAEILLELQIRAKCGLLCEISKAGRARVRSFTAAGKRQGMPN